MFPRRLHPAALPLTLLCASCSRTEHVEARSALPTVAVAKTSHNDLSRNLVLTAEFRPFQEVDVMAKVAGYVKQINVDVGDRVKAGQLLVTLEVPEMTSDLARAAAATDRSNAEVARARDEVTRAESAHQMAHLSYERLAGVAKTRAGLVAQQEVDDAHSRDLVAESQVAAAKSNLMAASEAVRMSQAEQGKTETLYDYTRVTAPFAGVVTKRYANTGSMIQAGTASQTQVMPVVRLSQNSLLRLVLPVPESAVPRVHVGQGVDVRVPSLNRTFPGKVSRFAGTLQLSTRTMDTQVDVPNPGLVIVPGMYAEVDLMMDRREDALSVPVTAVETGEAGTGKVMVVAGGNRLEVRPVSLGMETANLVEVRSGLREGDLVVVGNRSGLQAGQHVQPKLTALAALKGGE